MSDSEWSIVRNLLQLISTRRMINIFVLYWEGWQFTCFCIPPRWADSALRSHWSCTISIKGSAFPCSELSDLFIIHWQQCINLIFIAIEFVFFYLWALPFNQCLRNRLPLLLFFSLKNLKATMEAFFLLFFPLFNINLVCNSFLVSPFQSYFSSEDNLRTSAFLHQLK